MKRTSFIVGCILLLLLSANLGYAQTGSKENGPVDIKNELDEDDGPVMFKFEPDYISSIEKRRQEIAQTKEILDTLDISENKRRKLLRDLYKNGVTKRLSKALVADTKFEDADN